MSTSDVKLGPVSPDEPARLAACDSTEPSMRLNLASFPSHPPHWQPSILLLITWAKPAVLLPAVRKVWAAWSLCTEGSELKGHSYVWCPNHGCPRRPVINSGSHQSLIQHLTKLQLSLDDTSLLHHGSPPITCCADRTHNLYAPCHILSTHISAFCRTCQTDTCQVIDTMQNVIVPTACYGGSTCKLSCPCGYSGSGNSTLSCPSGGGSIDGSHYSCFQSMDIDSCIGHVHHYEFAPHIQQKLVYPELLNEVSVQVD